MLRPPLLRHPTSRRALQGFALAAIFAGLTAAGCSSEAPGGVPFTRTDASIPDRVVVEAPPAEVEVRPESGDGPTDGDDAAEVSEVGDTASDAEVATPTMVAVTINSPADNAVVTTQQPFVPLVDVTVTLPPGMGTDDVNAVNGEIWSTEMPPKKLSSNKMTLSSRPGGEVDRVVSYLYSETPFDLSGLESGTYELRVEASTNSGARGTASRALRADAGPRIIIRKPTEGSSYKGSIAAQVQIEDALFGPVAGVTMTIGNETLTVSGPTGNPPRDFTTLIDFTAYKPPLDGDQLFKVTAANANGTKAVATSRFVIDNAGPKIEQAEPAAGAIIGAITVLAARVSDPAKVVDSSVIAVVAHGSERFEVPLDPDPVSPGRYLHQFDTRLLDAHDVYPTISFRASDQLGNQSSIGYTVALDNTPPLADLDPPPNFRALLRSEGVTRCSWEFDPLGTDSVNDGDIVNQLFDIRARVEDRGNTPFAGGIDVVPLSLLDPGRVEMLVLDDTTQPLVVDSNNDGVCDKVNPLLVPTTIPMSSKEALLVNLVPVPPSGSPNMTPDPSALAAGCLPGTDTIAPDVMCTTTDMTVAISYAFSREAAVWGVAPVMASTPICVGNQFDAFANNISDGWACVAVRAADKLGNQQVSRVLRVCVDHDAKNNECPQRPVAGVSGGTPISVDTGVAHGLSSGDQVLLGRTRMKGADGTWTISVTGPTTFTLNGSSNDPALTSAIGFYVLKSLLPDCTGTQTALQPATVNNTACTPWSAYPPFEKRTLN